MIRMMANCCGSGSTAQRPIQGGATVELLIVPRTRLVILVRVVVLLENLCKPGATERSLGAPAVEEKICCRCDRLARGSYGSNVGI